MRSKVGRPLAQGSRQATVRKPNGKDERKALVIEKKAVPCADCGQNYPHYVMDFDHVRGVKLISIGSGRNLSMELLREEIEKCEVVCANCHRIRTWQRRQEN